MCSGVEHPTEIDADRRERLWLLFFAPASFLYRVVVMLAIAVFVASEYLVIGVLIAIWPLFSACCCRSAGPWGLCSRVRDTSETGRAQSPW